MIIPKQIKVGGLRYKVAQVDSLSENVAGLISTEKLSIKIAKGHPDFMRITFLHEILHAVNMELEENTVEFLAQALYQIIVDNPQMFEKKVGEQKI